jgi:hypothetical protein
MWSCYEEAIYDVNNPINVFIEMGLCKHGPPHTVLYEWEVSPEQWRKATEPLKQIYIRDFLDYFLFILFCYLVVPIIGAVIMGDFSYYIYYANIFYDYLVPKFILSVWSAIWVPILLLILLGTLIAFKRVRKPDKHIFFMTNGGIFNGRVYATMLQEYQLDEKECKFSLLLKQCNMFNLKRGWNRNLLAGTSGPTHTFWNVFFTTKRIK